MGVLIVTGGGRGIGAEICRRAARRGWDVAVNYANDEAAAAAVAEEARAAGARAMALQADVGDPAAVEAMFARIDDALGPAVGLVNNAGIMGSVGPVEALDPEKTRRLFDVNILGAFYCAKAAVRRMSTRHGGAGGAIVNISSAASQHGGSGFYVDYAATKAAIEGMTVGLAREQAAAGVRVSCVRPGFTLTEMNERYMKEDPEVLGRILPQIPLGRGADPGEIAEAALWLLSDRASYAQGALIDVTGGWTCP